MRKLGDTGADDVPSEDELTEDDLRALAEFTNLAELARVVRRARAICDAEARDLINTLEMPSTAIH